MTTESAVKATYIGTMSRADEVVNGAELVI